MPSHVTVFVHISTTNAPPLLATAASWPTCSFVANWPHPCTPPLNHAPLHPTAYTAGLHDDLQLKMPSTWHSLLLLASPVTSEPPLALIKTTLPILIVFYTLPGLVARCLLPTSVTCLGRFPVTFTARFRLVPHDIMY